MDAGNNSQSGHPESHRRGRCPVCGRAAFTNGQCSACTHAEVRTIPPSSITTFEQGNPEPVNLPLDAFDSFRGLATSNPVHPLNNDAERNAISRRVFPPRFRPCERGASTPEVSGRVIYISHPSSEPMDFDPWRWVAIPAWGMVMLVAPIAVALVVWQTAGFLSAFLVALTSLLALRYLFSNRLLDSWHLVSALNGRHVVEPMPVFMVRLRQWNDREIQLRLKGHFSGGSLMEGDRIRATGAWRGGVFRVKEAFCERTGARMAPRQSNAFVFAVTGSVFLVVLCLWMLLAGVPWASRQVSEFRSSNPESPITYPLIESIR